MPANDNDGKPATYDVLRGQTGHYSDTRYAFLFAPGVYNNAKINVGYYTQVAGLGQKVDDVKFIGGQGVHSLPVYPTVDPGSLDNFWRSAENFASYPVITEKDVYPGTKGQYDRTTDLEFPKGMVWAVSQAAPLRRVVTDALFLNFAGFQASGGFIANVKIVDNKNNDNIDLLKEGCQLEFGSQQQFFTRNCDIPAEITPVQREALKSGKFINVAEVDKEGVVDGSYRRLRLGAWSNVFVGTKNAPATKERGGGGGEGPVVSTIADTEICAEKPFITWSGVAGDHFKLQVPKVKRASSGTDLDAADTFETVDFSQVYVVRNDEVRQDDATSIQQALDSGLHILFTPATFKIERTLEVKHDGQVILGLGMASLVGPSDGKPIIRVPGDLVDVRIAGLTLQAGVLSSESCYSGSCLLEWGQKGEDQAKKSADSISGVLSDIFVRVGGPDKVDIDKVGVETMMRINSDYVIGDNLWLWRADHSVLLSADEIEMNRTPNKLYHKPTQREFKCDHSLEVNGNNVIMYGLFGEHTLKDVVRWNGENGKTFFFQCELAYDVDPETFITDATERDGYVGFRVADNVKSFEGYGMGVYCNFRDFDVSVPTAIRTPAVVTPNMVNLFTKYLDKTTLGGIKSVHNGVGSPVRNANGQTNTTPQERISVCSRGVALPTEK